MNIVCCFYNERRSSRGHDDKESFVKKDANIAAAKSLYSPKFQRALNVRVFVQLKVGQFYF